ncbi:MAG: YicC/YloC family endoribonuclease [Pirellulaceae bacterium]|nr:YicC family protein [Planctomycetales bacterium]MCA9201607.1 YicC family protein [Planctomycetales bacterium]
MLLSMTGHGEAHVDRDNVHVSVELRSVNNRYFKLNLRISDGYNGLESRIESLVRRYVHRGSVNANVRIVRDATPDDYHLNLTVLKSYRKQLESLCDELHLPELVHVNALLSLPGVVSERVGAAADADEDWSIVEAAVTQAAERLAEMRAEEGRAMQFDFERNAATITTELGEVESRAPLVVENYRTRLTERLNKLLAEYDVRVEPADVVREVGLFAERSDISEEIVRLRSHLEQFAAFIEQAESNGRKLEFLIQEMFREANTIGSKSNDARIAQHVVEIKTAVERMREMVQNVE